MDECYIPRIGVVAKLDEIQLTKVILTAGVLKIVRRGLKLLL